MQANERVTAQVKEWGILSTAHTEVLLQDISFVGYAGREVDFTCGTYKTYTLYLCSVLWTPKSRGSGQFFPLCNSNCIWNFLFFSLWGSSSWFCKQGTATQKLSAIESKRETKIAAIAYSSQRGAVRETSRWWTGVGSVILNPNPACCFKIHLSYIFPLASPSLLFVLLLLEHVMKGYFLLIFVYSDNLTTYTTR